MLPIVVHPAIVHFPLAMLFAAWVCLLTLHVTGHERWDERVRLFELVGVATAPLAILTGFVDDTGTVFDLVWRDPVVWHALAATGATVMYGLHWRWRRVLPAGDAITTQARLDIVWATGAMWLFVLAGFIGGEMVHA